MNSRRQNLRHLPRRAQALVTALIASAVFGVGAGAFNAAQPVHARLVALTACGIGAVLLTACWTQLQRDLDRGAIPCAHGPWFVAMLLSGTNANVPIAVALVQLTEWLVVERGRVAWWRPATNGAIAITSAALSCWIPWDAARPIAFLLANNVLVAAFALSVAGLPAVRRMLDVRMQASAVGMCLLGVPIAIMAAHPWLVTTAIVPLIGFMHWTTLRTQTGDPDQEATGASTEEAWSAIVGGALPSLCAGAVTVVLCEPSAAIHSLIRADVREEDLIGETADGFVIFQPMVGNITGAATSVAIRLRDLLREHAVGVGYAVKPDTGQCLSDLLAAAHAHALIDESWRLQEQLRRPAR